MISSSSCLASSAPATSSKVTLGVSGEISLALDRPNWNALFPPPCMVRMIQNQNRIRMIQGSAVMRKVHHGVCSGSPVRMTPWASRSSMRLSLMGPRR